MHRQPRARRALLAVGLLHAASIAPAQGIGGLLRTVDGSPLAQARVWLAPAPDGSDIAGLESELPAPATLLTHSDEHGAFRFAADASGVLVVLHANGSGAVEAVSRGGRSRIVAQPGAAVVLPDGGSLLALQVEVASQMFGLGTSLARDGELRLPAGQFRALLGYRDGSRSEHALALRSGDRVTLFRPSAPSVRVAIAAADGAEVVVDRWFDRALTVRDGAVTVWPTVDRKARRLRRVVPGPQGAATFVDGLLLGDDVRWSDQVPAAWHDQALAVDTGTVLALQVTPRLRLLATAPIRGGRAMVPAVADPLAYLVLAPGQALRLRQRSELHESWPGFALQVTLMGASAPVAATPCALLCGGLTRRGSTDLAGRVVFTNLSAQPAELRLVGGEVWLPPVTLAAETIRTGRAVFTAEVGATLRGRVLVEGQRLAARGVSLTLRDPTGTLGFDDRQIEVDGAGRFVARGLPPQARFTLFCALNVGPLTYSAKLHGVLSDSEVEIDLRSEDVPLPGRGR